MSKFLSLICSAAAMVVVSSNGFAQQTQNNQTTSSPKKTEVKCNDNQVVDKTTGQCVDFFQQGMAMPDNKVQKNDTYPAAYNQSARVKTNDGWDLGIDASFIYWYTSQDNMDIAYIPATAPATTGQVAYQNFSWEPGFKVGLGLGTNHDDWCLNAEYTWLHQNKTTGTFVAPTGQFWHPTDWFNGQIGELGTTYTDVSSKWNMKLDLLDIGGSRPFYQGKMLTIIPSGGFRALWIRQSMGINMSSATLPLEAASMNATANSWALGAKGGVTTHWMVWKGARIEGTVNASLLYTRYTTLNHSETDSGAPAALTSFASNNNMGCIRPTIDMGLGLGYGGYFFKNKCFLDLVARYDFNYFWEQNVMREFALQTNGTATTAGDLMLQGLTLTLSLAM